MEHALNHYSNYLLYLTSADHSGTAVFARSNTGIVDSNPTRGMDVFVRLFCVSRGLASAWSPVQGVLPTVKRN
jgi:hypothetical protein